MRPGSTPSYPFNGSATRLVPVLLAAVTVILLTLGVAVQAATTDPRCDPITPLARHPRVARRGPHTVRAP